MADEIAAEIADEIAAEIAAEHEPAAEALAASPTVFFVRFSFFPSFLLVIF